MVVGVLGALAGGLLLARRPAARRAPSAPPDRQFTREAEELREQLAAGEIADTDYRFLRERLVARMAVGGRGSVESAGRQRSRWFAAAGVGAALIVAFTLVPALHQRGPGQTSTGDDFSGNDGNSGMVAWRSAERALQAGQLTRAIGDYRLAVAFLSDQSMLRARFGFALAKSGRTREALDQLSMAVHSAPRLPEVRLYLGAVLLRAGQRRRAFMHWRRFLALQPTGPNAALVRRSMQRAAVPRSVRRPDQTSSSVGG